MPPSCCSSAIPSIAGVWSVRRHLVCGLHLLGALVASPPLRRVVADRNACQDLPAGWHAARIPRKIPAHAARGGATGFRKVPALAAKERPRGAKQPARGARQGHIARRAGLLSRAFLAALACIRRPPCRCSRAFSPSSPACGLPPKRRCKTPTSPLSAFCHGQPLSPRTSNPTTRRMGQRRRHLLLATSTTSTRSLSCSPPPGPPNAPPPLLPLRSSKGRSRGARRDSRRRQDGRRRLKIATWRTASLSSERHNQSTARLPSARRRAAARLSAAARARHNSPVRHHILSHDMAVKHDARGTCSCVDESGRDQRDFGACS